MSSLAQARAAKAQLLAELERRGERAGVGLTRSGGQYCLKVSARDARTAERLPATMAGVEVQVAVVGEVHAQR